MFFLLSITDTGSLFPHTKNNKNYHKSGVGQQQGFGSVGYSFDLKLKVSSSRAFMIII
jgi:hypothetical protein